MAVYIVVSAHPDDETIGCGGTCVKLTQAGHSVYLLVMTQIYNPDWELSELPKRRAEAVSAAKILGITDVFFAEFKTGHLNSTPMIDLSKSISKIVTKICPEIVYLPPRGDLHSDHDAVFRAGMISCRSLFSSSIQEIRMYEIATTTRFNTGSQDRYFMPNYYVDITKEMDTKLLAMQSYQSELKEYPHPRSVQGLKILAEERGLLPGMKYAEAFQIVFKKEF